jgi:large subunit ribosomal protein L21
MNMYAIFENGSHQFRVQEGDRVTIDRRDGAPGSEVVFERVLLVSGGESPVIGTPYVEGARVVGTLESTYRGKKILIKKFRRRKGYRLKKGHRQDYSTVRITQVVAG